MKTVSCLRRPLAGGEQCVVEECACGSIHLTIGAVTLRLCPNSAADLTTTLTEAMQQWAMAQLGGGPILLRHERGEGASS
jgi:hypothetical protein